VGCYCGGCSASLTIRPSAKLKITLVSCGKVKAEQLVDLDELKPAHLITTNAAQVRLTLQEIYNLSSMECFRRKLIQWCE
jgi:hypothetical protein